MSGAMRRRGASLVEALLGLAIAGMVVGLAFGLYRFGVVATGGTVAPQVGLQMASRKALVDFIREIQETVEIVRPPAGSTLSYFVARDKVNRILTAYLVRNGADSSAAGRDLYDLWVHRKDYPPEPSTQVRLLGHVERLTFTTLSPGLLQIHLELNEAGKTYSLLTAVRSRNILTEGRL